MGSDCVLLLLLHVAQGYSRLDFPLCQLKANGIISSNSTSSRTRCREAPTQSAGFLNPQQTACSCNRAGSWTPAQLITQPLFPPGGPDTPAASSYQATEAAAADPTTEATATAAGQQLPAPLAHHCFALCKAAALYSICLLTAGHTAPAPSPAQAFLSCSHPASMQCRAEQQQSRRSVSRQNSPLLQQQ